MKNPTIPELFFSTEGFAADPHLVAVTETKTSKLHRHQHPRVGAVRVRVTRETPRSAPPHFAVCVTAHRAGADCVVHAVASEPLPAVDAAFHKLERLVADVSGGRRTGRRHPHPVELPVAFPKA